MIDPYSIGVEPGTIEISGIQRRILGTPTMADNLKVSIEQHPKERRTPNYITKETNQNLPSELKDLQINGFENSCPMIDLGCSLAKNARKYMELCSTKDYEYCSHLDEIIAGGAMKSPLTFLFGDSD